MGNRFHRRVNVRWKQEDENAPDEKGDIMAPDPEIAASLVGALLVDWSVTEINITIENVDAETT